MVGIRQRGSLMKRHNPDLATRKRNELALMVYMTILGCWVVIGLVYIVRWCL